MIRTALSFDDVLLVPRYSAIESRWKDTDVTGRLGDIQLDVPIISSPMDTVTGISVATAMAKMGGLGVVHRYNQAGEQEAVVRLAVSRSRTLRGPDPIIGAAVGVTGDFEARAALLVEAGARVICVDVAHGHHELVRRALKRLRAQLGSDVHLMAGSVATLEGFNALADWGADSVRVGIGGGSCCSTRIRTGHGMPTLQSVLDCASSDRDASLIADGGIRNSGDIVKALAAGADVVMVGSLLAGTTEAPGSLVRVDGQLRKTYRGMASREAQVEWRGHVASLEGISTTVPIIGDIDDVVKDLLRGVRSGLSYSGCSTIPELQARAQFVRQTPAGAVESAPHIDQSS
ncbi:MAG TPA: guanosine monophosphate reductase [Pseudomonadales bacterium]|nr:guanosine monophosphate reductase [Pseudomonadales bacterium]